MSAHKVNLDLERSGVGIGIRKIGQWVSYDQFTDETSDAVGYINLNKKIPAGSLVLCSKVTVTEGFAGDTTAKMDIGVSADIDDFSFTEYDVLAVGANKISNANADSSDTSAGPFIITSDTTVRVTVTGTADFTSITAGKAYVEVIYLSTNPEVIDPVQTRYDE